MMAVHDQRSSHNPPRPEERIAEMSLLVAAIIVTGRPCTSQRPK
jgi:hypothetical protein